MPRWSTWCVLRMSVPASSSFIPSRRATSPRSEEHTSELQSPCNLVCRLLLEKKQHPQVPAEVASLLRKQHGRCAWCGLYFTTEDIRERDHLIPHRRKLKGGGSANQLLHGHCH